MIQHKKYQAYFRYKLIIAFCFVISAGCGILSEDDDYFNGSMQARVKNELIIFDEAYGNLVLGDDMTWSGISKINGITNLKVSGSEIQIDFPFNPVTGKTYHPGCMYRTWTGNYYDYNNLTAYNTKPLNQEGSEFSSSVTFTSITDKSYEGTFSFMAYIADLNLNDTLVVTDGKFKIASSGKKW